MKMPFFASALALLLAVTPADAALNAYLIMKGTKQGEIKGSVTQKGRENTIMVIAVDHQVRNDKGKVHGVYTITKELDKSSPLLYRALANGETMASFELQFWTPRVGGAMGGGGTEVQHYTVKLTNARIVDMKFKMLNNKNPELMRYAEFEEVSFTYETISWTWNDGGISTSDTSR